MQRLTIAILIFVAVCIAVARADLGPKPEATFVITADNAAHVVQGVLLMCEVDDCSDERPLENIGPQRVYCRELECMALAYGFAPYLRLQLTLSDGRTVTSHVFTKAAFDANFVATVAGDELIVKEKPADPSGIFNRQPETAPAIR